MPRKFFVGSMAGANEVVFMGALPSKLSYDDAIELAAEIVCIADPLGEKFTAALKRMQGE